MPSLLRRVAALEDNRFGVEGGDRNNKGGLLKKYRVIQRDACFSALLDYAGRGWAHTAKRGMCSG